MLSIVLSIVITTMLAWGLLAALFRGWLPRSSEFRPEGSTLDAMLVAALRLQARARTFILAPVPMTIAIVAAWASFLLAPGTAHASTLAPSSGSSGGLLCALGLLFGVAVFGMATADVPVPFSPADIGEDPVTPPYLDKALWAILLAPVLAILNAKLHLGLDTPTVCTLVVAIIAYVVAHKNKSKAIALANIQGRSAAYGALVNSQADKSPSSAATALDSIGRVAPAATPAPTS